MANRTWWQGRAATLSWLVALVAGLIVAAAYPAAANSGGGSKTPAVAVAPHYKVAGHANPAAPPTFTCQVTTPAQCFGPAQIRAAYGIDQVHADGTGRTIVIVDAFQSPTIQHDLNLFDQVFELPDTTVQIIAPDGLTPFNQADPNQTGWAGEISLDVEWAHAIAPGAKILLVEATSNSFTNLLAAEDYAANDAQYVSNSWGASEFSGENAYDGHFSHSGVSFFVSSGDNGTPAEYPSSSPNVISVGGTTLHFNGGNFSSETGWSGSGGGCSVYETATTAQSSFGQYGQVNCAGKRATPDVSLDADPASGVSVYDSTRYQGQKGWWQVGGTSASSPMVAARAAVAGTVVNSAYVYGSSISYRDITSGNNGASCLVGYDLVTGRGSWTH